MAEQTNLPSIPPPNENNLVAFARAVKEALEVRLGRRGQGLDAMVTFRDLDKVQMVLGDGRGGVAGLKPPAAIGTVGGGYDPTLDTTPPPAPQNVKASGAVRNVILEWDGPPATYRNHAYAEVWRSSTNNLNDAAQIGQSGSTMYVDNVGEGQARYYWVRFVSQADVTGPWHAAGDAGEQAVTALDVGYTLGLLEGQIGETQLFETLGARIDLIDGADTLAGSVNARLLAEAQARGQDLLNEASARAAAISVESSARQSADGALATQITTVVANYQAADAATLTSAQGYADSAAENAAGAALSTAQAAVQAEAAARASADGALAESITTVQTIVGGNTAAIQTQATSINGLSAQYTIKVQAGEIVGGIGLAAESPDGSGGMIDFAVRANRFYVAPPAGQGDTKTALFTHYTTPTTINGVSIPAGTYMDAAFMRTFVAQKGQIGALAVDDAAVANLSAAKLTAGDGTIGGILKSANYVSGVSGWAVHPSGWLEAANATVRGTVYADTGWFKGQIIGGAATTYTSGTGMWTGVDGGTWKFRLGSGSTYLRWDGASLTLRGTLTIEDSSGNVLLSSGTGIPWTQINSRPTSLSGLNANEGSKLAGIASGADVTRLNTAAAIAGQGAFATLSKINASNVTAYVANAALGNAQIGGNLWSTNWNYAGGTGWLLDRSGNFYGNNIYARGDIEASSLKANTAMVGTAHIGNLAVTTAKIGNNAVTIPVSAYTEGLINSGPSWTTVQSVACDPEGGSVSLVCSAMIEVSSGMYSKTEARILSPSGGQVSYASVSHNYINAVAAISLTGRSNQSGTYSFQVRNVSTIAKVTYRSLIAIGSKK